MKRYKNDTATIFHGDVLKCFAEIKSESIDLVFADPPYNIGKDFNGIEDKYDEDEYICWMTKWINEIFRVLSPTGSAYIMNSTQNFAHMDLISRKRFYIISRIIWAYDSSSVQARNKFGSSWEPILHMCKNPKQYTFNTTDIQVEAKTGSQRKLIDYRKTPPQPYNTKKVPSNTWQIPRVRFKMEEYENHPTQKPHKLLERIILASSNKGDTVLDPFSGSFSTGFAAVSLGRNFVGFELNEDFVKIGIRRLSIPSHYKQSDIAKNKIRKTKNKSKKDHSSHL